MTNYFSDIKNKVVIVTGGSKGIGKEIALEYSRLGAKVVIIGRNIDDLNKVKKELDEYSKENLAVNLDINDVKALNQKVDEIYQKYKAIDILVNNAGINITKDAFEITEEDWDTVLDTNLKATF